MTCIMQHILYIKYRCYTNFTDHILFSLSDCNWTKTQNHLGRKRKLNHLAKLT